MIAHCPQVVHVVAASQSATHAVVTLSACGKKVAVQSATVQETVDLAGRNKKCADAGKPLIDVIKFDDQTAATNAVVLGQAEAVSADSPVIAYAVSKSDGKLVLDEEYYEDGSRKSVAK